MNIGKTIKITKEQYSDIKSKNIMAYANGIPITIEEFELKMKTYQLEGYIQGDTEYEKALKRLARIKVLYKMAEDNKLVPTYEEALEVSLNECNNLYKDEKATNAMEEYINSLNTTSDEYWNDYHVNELILFMSINKLKAKFIKDAIADNKLTQKNSTSTSIPKEHIEYINNHIKEIENSIKVEIVNERYK